MSAGASIGYLSSIGGGSFGPLVVVRETKSLCELRLCDTFTSTRQQQATLITC